jgi:transposase
MIEQRAVIRFFTLKGLKSSAIWTELQSVYGPQAFSISAVKKWQKRFREGRSDLFDDPRSGRPLAQDLAGAIRSMLEERPFSSCKSLCRHFRVAKTTCLRILHNDLGLTKLHLRWVPHTLNADQKNERMSLSSQLLAILQQEQQIEFERVLTGDESWFFLYYPPDSAWAVSRDALPERVKQTIDTEKCLISVFWSVNAIHSLVDVPKGMKYNTTFFYDTVMPGIIGDITSHSRRKTLKNFFLHMDNATPHNSKQSQECIQASRAQRLPHPAYSPDLAPSDFFLFGYLKEKLTDFPCATREQLKIAIIEIFSGIDREILLSVFHSWMKRLKWVIKHGGEYYHK